MPNMVARMNRPSSETPRTSIRPVALAALVGMNFAASTISTIPIGTFTRKIPRQDQTATNTPPTPAPPAADAGPDDPADGQDAGEHADRAVTVPPEMIGDDAGGRGHERAAADRLDSAQQHQHEDVVGESTGQ